MKNEAEQIAIMARTLIEILNSDVKDVSAAAEPIAKMIGYKAEKMYVDETGVPLITKNLQEWFD